MDILEPVSIDTTAFENILALLLIGSVPVPPLGWTEAHSLRIYRTEDDPTNELKAMKDLASASAGTNVGEAHNKHHNEGHEFRDGVIPSASPRIIHHYAPKRGWPAWRLNDQPNAIVSLKAGQSLPCGLGPVRMNDGNVLEIALSSKDIRRWELATEALRKFDRLQAPEDLYYENNMPEYQGLSLDSPNLLFKGMVPGGSKLERYSEMVFSVTTVDSMFVSGVILPLIYGGVHLSAWNYSFPSTQECIMWRMSGIGIMAVIPLTVFMEIITLRLCFVIFGPVFYAMSTSYAFCRAFLVVEAFLSLRHAPLGVYAAVPWVQNIPHI